jgi:hypothetical protein
MAATESIFGRIVTGADVEAWTWYTLKRWIGTYLSEVERQAGLVAGTLARPRSFTTAPSLDNWPEDQLPALLVLSPGMNEVPQRRGDGYYKARWNIAVACVVSASTEHDSRTLAMRYTAALRALLLQRSSLDGQAQGVAWLSERYDELAYDDVRSLMAGVAEFLIDAESVTNAKAGPTTPDDPLDPDTDPWAAWPTVQSVDIDIENEVPQIGGTK